MPIIRPVQIIIEEDVDTGKSTVMLQVGTDNPVDTGIRAASAAGALAALACTFGGNGTVAPMADDSLPGVTVA